LMAALRMSPWEACPTPIIAVKDRSHTPFAAQASIV
jgi:hypothetical protein